MPNFIEIKSIKFDKSKTIEPEWQKKFLEKFPDAKTLKQNQYFRYLYDKALPYDELIYLENCCGYTPDQMSEVYTARDMIKYFIVSIERYDNYVGKGNHL